MPMTALERAREKYRQNAPEREERRRKGILSPLEELRMKRAAMQGTKGAVMHDEPAAAPAHPEASEPASARLAPAASPGAAEDARTLTAYEERSTTLQRTEPERRTPGGKNRLESEEQMESPAILRHAYVGDIEVARAPRSIQDLIMLLEDLAYADRNSESIRKMVERLPSSFVSVMREKPMITLPRTYLDIQTEEGIARYCFGAALFDWHGRMMRMMYVTRPSGETRVAIAYMSRSQAVWRLLPDIDYGMHFDKGRLGQHAYTLPYEVQVVLDRLLLNARGNIPTDIDPAAIITSPPRDFDSTGLRLHAERLQGIANTIFMDSSRPAQLPQKAEPPQRRYEPYIGYVVEADFEGIRKFFSELQDGLWPDFTSGPLSANRVPSEIYGGFNRVAVLSRDRSLRYVFNVTADGVFFGSIEAPLSNINKYGLHEKAVVASFPEDIMTPLAEYYEELKNGMRPGGQRGSYCKVDGFHDKVPILAQAERYFARTIEGLRRLADFPKIA